jgi:hypothetical protein
MKTDLHNDPENATLQQQQGETKIQFQEIETRKLARKAFRAQVRWRYRGDMVCREYFQAVREQPISTAITGLKDA